MNPILGSPYDSCEVSTISKSFGSKNKDWQASLEPMPKLQTPWNCTESHFAQNIETWKAFTMPVRHQQYCISCIELKIGIVVSQTTLHAHKILIISTCNELRATSLEFGRCLNGLSQYWPKLASVCKRKVVDVTKRRLTNWISGQQFSTSNYDFSEEVPECQILDILSIRKSLNAHAAKLSFDLR